MPGTAATIGFAALLMRPRNWNTGACSSVGGAFRKSSRSFPELKLPSLPRSRIARIALSSCASASASAIVWYIAAVSAFFFAARAIVIVITPSARST